jgi:hypothetical protein
MLDRSVKPSNRPGWGDGRLVKALKTENEMQLFVIMIYEYENKTA